MLSYSREVIRQTILSRNDSAAILVSTHHVDDVEIIAKRVWYIDNR